MRRTKSPKEWHELLFEIEVKARAAERERILTGVTELHEDAVLSGRAYEYIVNIIEGDDE